MSARRPQAVGILLWSVLTSDAFAQAPSTGADVGRVAGRVVSSYAGVVSDATVTLVRSGAEGARADEQTTRSDRQGEFRFEKVPPGRYSIAVSKDGYSNRQLITTPAPRFETGTAITVTGGETVPSLELRLRRAASIAGRVAEPDGIPAPDVHVFAALRQGTGYVLLPDTRATTAWDGRYEITALPPGDYLVVVQPLPSADPARATANAERRAPESSSSTRPPFAPTLYPGVAQAEGADTIRVIEGISAEGIDVWLTPPQRYSVSGRIFWPDDLDVENIAIEYTGVSPDRSELWVVSDPGGVFTITGVAAGPFVMLARADSNKGPLAGVASTDVRVGHVEDIRLTLVRPGAIEGRLVYEVDMPVAARPRTISLRQTLVRVSPLYPTPESTIGPDGRFRLDRALGEYDFELRGLPDGIRITRVMRNGQQIPRSHIGVAANEVVSGVEVFVGR